MYPILCKVRYEKLHRVFRARDIWVQIGFSVIVNWIVAPFFMLALAWAFLPDEPELRQGLILVGLARCIAMVLIWTGLAGGDNEYCAILVAINSLLQMVLFAPMGVFFIQVISGDSITFEYAAAAKSVAVFLGIPLGTAILTRFILRWTTSARWYDEVFLKWISPWSLIGLLFTILVLFASQGRQVVHQIVSVIRVAAPLIVYFAVMFFATVFIAYRFGFGYKLAATQSFTAASNNFELAIAVAVATFGGNSNQALAATVGPLIEVPVLLGLVHTGSTLGGGVGHLVFYLIALFLDQAFPLLGHLSPCRKEYYLLMFETLYKFSNYLYFRPYERKVEAYFQGATPESAPQGLQKALALKDKGDQRPMDDIRRARMMTGRGLGHPLGNSYIIMAD
ncbi:hypothetical protein BBP40_001920 [Aspergillus hancockii]|nr:hypothetical protein BBP40_001920 [Aspergillus hancockii]